jgi:hypothetical protein
MTELTVIHWFRRDLRLTDNLALNAASGSGGRVVPLFIVDPALLKSPHLGVRAWHLCSRTAGAGLCAAGTGKSSAGTAGRSAPGIARSGG